MKDKILATCLLLIMTLNIMDVLTDITLEVPLWHIIEEIVIVLLSGALAGFIMYDMHMRTKRLRHLTSSLNEAESKVHKITERFKEARREYFEIIQQQFDDWNLSQSEKEVALLMLKGLNFQEISTIRNTKVKTARHQASSIYSKSGLEGRHELSAWFIEDFIAIQSS